MSLTPGLQLPYGIQPTTPSPVDAWSGPYEGTTLSQAILSANTAISQAIRYKSMIVRLLVSGTPKLYWYQNGTTDADLVEVTIDKYETGANAGTDTEVRSLTSNWQSTYTTVQTNSATWGLGGGAAGLDSAVRSLTSNWQSTYTNFASQSANNAAVYSMVAANSSTNWNYQGSDLKALSGNWQGTFSTVQTTSSTWGLDSAVRSLTSNWQSTYTNFASQSANNAAVYSMVAANSSTNWNYQGSDLKALSANWQKTYTTVQTSSAGWGSGGMSTITQMFSAPGSYVWSKPAGAKSITVQMFGGGGGGGAGGIGTWFGAGIGGQDYNMIGGGGGGAGGSYLCTTIDLNNPNNLFDNVSVQVGAGGLGGPYAFPYDWNSFESIRGDRGQDGGSSSFGYIICPGGMGGEGGGYTQNTNIPLGFSLSNGAPDDLRLSASGITQLETHKYRYILHYKIPNLSIEDQVDVTYSLRDLIVNSTMLSTIPLSPIYYPDNDPTSTAAPYIHEFTLKEYYNKLDHKTYLIEEQLAARRTSRTLTVKRYGPRSSGSLALSSTATPANSANPLSVNQVAGEGGYGAFCNSGGTGYLSAGSDGYLPGGSNGAPIDAFTSVFCFGGIQGGPGGGGGEGNCTNNYPIQIGGKGGKGIMLNYDGGYSQNQIDGTNNDYISNIIAPGTGGGGGFITYSNYGVNGGAGGFPAAGGGGGGAGIADSPNSTQNGSGGPGGDGLVVVTTYF